MVNKLKFNWSAHNRDSLYDILWQIRDRVIDQPLTASQVRNILGKQIQSHLPVKIRKRLDAAVETGYIYIGGAYHSYLDQIKKPCIEVIFAYNPFDEYVTINQSRYRRMCRLFADVILHEIIHMRQYRRRNFKIIPDYNSNTEKDDLRQEQNYLGCSDEVDAYAFNIACELLDKCSGNKQTAIEYLSKRHHRGRLKSNSLRIYLKAFEYDREHTIIKRLKKRVVRYMTRAEQGKPFKSKDWICH